MMAEPTFTELQAIIPNNTSSTLKLNLKKINKMQAEIIARALRLDTNTEILDLSNSEMFGEVFAILVEALIEHPTLHTLILTGNRIGDGEPCDQDVGVEALAKLLKANRRLRTLNLSHNRLDNFSGFHITVFAIALQNSLLEDLDLSNNYDLRSHLSPLAQALASNVHLQVFHLNNNKIGGKETRSLAYALTQNSSLVELYLASNDMSKYDFDRFGLFKNFSLQILKIDDDKIDKTQAETINTLLERNRRLALYWAEVAVVIAFTRANFNHPLVHSIEPLARYVIPQFMRSRADTSSRPAFVKKAAINIDNRPLENGSPWQ